MEPAKNLTEVTKASIRERRKDVHRFGISVYPEHSTPGRDEEYIRLAAKYGFRRIFTCLLSVKEPPDIIKAKFSKFIHMANDLGFIVGVDTNPEVFAHLGAAPADLGVFAKMGVGIIRLDGHFSDREDIAMTHNPYGIAIEFNASSNIGLELMLERGADAHHMEACHNFYPQKYTGLGWGKFMEFTDKYKGLGLPVSAFVSSNNKDTYGPWPVSEGLATCEIHRNLPIDLQARHLLATAKIDDIIIGNAYASEEELRMLSVIDTGRITLRMDTEKDILPQEKEVIFGYSHFDRVDASEHILRSSVARENYRNISIPQRKSCRQQAVPGDVVVVNDCLSHYRGELQIIRKELPYQEYWNYVGKVKENERIILQLLKPEYLFGFIKD